MSAAWLRQWRELGWRDSLYVLTYPIKTWRCRLFGHKWGPEDRDYEPNTGCLLQAWHECQRKRCEGYQETWHYLGTQERIYG